MSPQEAIGHARPLLWKILVPVWAFVVFFCILYLTFQGHRRLILRLEFERTPASAGHVAVWWTARNRPLNLADSITVELPSGATTASVPVPVDIDTLQVRIGDLAGTTLRLHQLRLATPYSTLARWGSADRFSGWRAQGGVESSLEEPSGLVLRVTAADALLQIDDIHTLRDRTRRMNHALLAVAGALLMAALHWLVFARGEPSRARLGPIARSGTAPASAPSRARTAARWIVAASALGAALATAFILRRQPATPPAVFSDTGEYSLAFVDHLGRRVSERDGGLHLQLDPFALYRNEPNQTTRRFRIDAHGYRGGFDANDHRPRVLIVGGSAAFGFGLEEDAQVFSAQLAAAAPQWQFVNAAVVGYLSGQELAELVHRGRDVQPTAVIAVDGWNDLYVPLLAAARFPMRNVGAGFNWDILALVESRLRSYTAGGLGSAWPSATSEDLDSLIERLLATYVANVEAMQEWSKARGSSFLVVLQPWVGSRRNPHPDEVPFLHQWSSVLSERTSPAIYDRFRARARQEFEKRQIRCLDLNESAGFATGNEGLFLDVMHPNALGHARITEQVQPMITTATTPFLAER